MSKHTPGPVERLARLAIWSDSYRTDEEFRDAVDAVLVKAVLYDAAPDLLAALKPFANIDEDELIGAPNDMPIEKEEGRS